MSAGSTEAAALYNQYVALPPHARAEFLALMRGTGALKEPKASPPPGRLPSLLYERIKSKLYSFRGIVLPPLSTLRKTSAEEELEAAVRWLQSGQKVPLETMTGLIEVAADSVALEIPWGNKHEKVTAQSVTSRLALIPSAVDRAFPGYQMNGLLHTVAAAIGGGRLPIVKDHT